MNSDVVPGDLTSAIEMLSSLDGHRLPAQEMDQRSFVAQQQLFVQNCLNLWKENGQQNLSETIGYFTNETVVDLAEFVSNAVWQNIHSETLDGEHAPKGIHFPSKNACPDDPSESLSLLFIGHEIVEDKEGAFVFFAECRSTGRYWIQAGADGWRNPTDAERAEVRKFLSESSE